MTEEVEVKVREIEETAAAGTTQITELLRRMILAGVGAVALTYDEAESFVHRLVERGEIAQKDGEKLLHELTDRVRQRPQLQVPDVGAQVENNLEQFLNRLNIPSKRDIDELSAKIAQLAARVEELRRSQDQPVAKGKSTATAQN
jgi:poly(hydroxyalkanoate) granule-associated protein